MIRSPLVPLNAVLEVIGCGEPARNVTVKLMLYIQNKYEWR